MRRATTFVPPPLPTVVRFRTWSDRQGVAATAEILRVSVSRVSHLRSGGMVPSLALAARIETASAGFIRPGDWIGAPGDAVAAAGLSTSDKVA